MIEQVKSEKKSGEKQDVLFSMPKNIRQIGQVENGRKIYVEDYVISFVRYLGKEATDQYKIAVLLGEAKECEGSTCIFVSGALEIEGVQIEECSCFPKEIWEGIYRLIEENFKEGNIVGWVVTKTGMVLEPTEWLEKIHIDNFAGQDKMLMLYDALEREEDFFLFESSHLKRVPGYFIYYEKNQEMQNYMLQKKGTVEKEVVDDYAMIEMRKKLEEMEGRKKKQKREKWYLRGAVLTCTILGIGVLSQNGTVREQIYGMFSNLSKETIFFQEETTGVAEDKQFMDKEESKITISGEDVIGDETAEKSKEGKNKKQDKSLDAIPVEQGGAEIKEQYYTIQPGDTLVSICMKEFQSLDRMDEIMELNQITDKDKIVAGQKIKLWE